MTSGPPRSSANPRSVAFTPASAVAAIFAAIAGTISTQGVGILVTYAKLVGDFYISISILIALMIFVAWLVVGRQMKPLLKAK